MLISFYKKNHVSIWNWIQHYYKPEKKLHRKRKRIYELLVDDETLIKVRIESVWVWVTIELIAKTILGIHIYLIKEACLLQNNLYNH